MPFFLEYDTGAEQLSILAGKIAGYHELFKTIGRSWPVLFWLHSAARERNLRTWLTDLPAVVPIATGSRDQATSQALSPPTPYGRQCGGGHRRVTLSALADVIARRHALDETLVAPPEGKMGQC